MGQKIKVKFSARTAADQDPALWTCLFPNRKPETDKCTFSFDPEDRVYDWLVVYEDLIPLRGEKRSNRIEPLACCVDNTLFITTEPSSIKNYGRNYLRQFGHVLSVQAREIIDHPNQIFQTPPLRWYYGRPLGDDETEFTSVDTLSSMQNPSRIERVSTVCSHKTMTPTLMQRFEFTRDLKKRLGKELEWFGRGVRPIKNKAEAMDAYCYHIAIENHIEDHHWTEKIADCFLSFSLPFYYGPKNISDYFPEESYIAINIFDVEESAKIITSALADKSYHDRLPAIFEARKRVLERYNLMQTISDLVSARHNLTQRTDDKVSRHKICGRHAFRRKHPFLASSDVLSARRSKRLF